MTKMDKPPVPDSPIGLLLSGGLDSGILLFLLLANGYQVQPFYIRAHLKWEAAELAALERLLARAGEQGLGELKVFDMPATDVYGAHWSVTGTGVPDAATEDDAVYLPGRNGLLLLKPALWCQLQGIPQLALAPLKSNPFPDATSEFFTAFEKMLALATGSTIHVWRPFAQLEKADVMRLASNLPLDLTFSCIDPVGRLHCGKCNKCHERRLAFASANLLDPTPYAHSFTLN